MATTANTQTAHVTCINKPNRNSPTEAITHIGGIGWTWPVARAIIAIEDREWSFYTLVSGNRAMIGVNKSALGRKFLQTYADGAWNNNLLALRECV